MGAHEAPREDGWEVVYSWITEFWISLGGAPSTLRGGDGFVAARMVMELLKRGLIVRDGDTLRPGSGEWTPRSHDHHFFRRVEDAISFADNVYGPRGD